MSAKCRPLVGSSRRRTLPCQAIWVASFRRWRSPPDSVVRGWPRLKYLTSRGSASANRSRRCQAGNASA